MRTAQSTWHPDSGWANDGPNGLEGAQLVLVFAGRGILETPDPLEAIQDTYPSATILGCSTAGEIADIEVNDGSLVATAIKFAGTRIESAQVPIAEVDGDSHAAGARIAGLLDPEGLRHVLVFSDGLEVNGSQLVEGLTGSLPESVTVTGGLSGDGAHFERTFVLSGTSATRGQVAAVGLYGDRIQVRSASLGGWDPFGPERKITRSEGNVLLELDGRSALELYREYLGEHADGLPGTGLLFPMAVRVGDTETPVVRTILGIDEARGSLTFAGDVPEGAHGRLMRANFERLVDGAASAAEASQGDGTGLATELAILISCVGRKMVLKQRVEEEVEAVRDVLGESAAITGFYSYGEISAFTPGAKCELHNQTMTITSISES